MIVVWQMAFFLLKPFPQIGIPANSLKHGSRLNSQKKILRIIYYQRNIESVSLLTSFINKY